jgi:hypothetical protein
MTTPSSARTAGNRAVPVEPLGVQTDGIAVLAQEHPVADDAHGLGHPDLIGHVAVLTVDRDHELGVGDRHHGGQLPLAGVAAHVDRVHAGVDDLHVQAVEAVDDPPDGPLVTGDGVGADDHHVLGPELEEAVLPGGQLGEGGHRLPLRAGGDDADLAVLQPVHVLHVDE